MMRSCSAKMSLLACSAACCSACAAWTASCIRWGGVVLVCVEGGGVRNVSNGLVDVWT